MNSPVVGALVAVLLTGVGCRGQTIADKVQTYRREQASGLLTDYEHARSRHDPLAICVTANQVSAAYRDANDPADADAWKAKASEDCRLARNLRSPDLGAGRVTRR